MWWLVKRKIYLSQEQVKIRILAYLYNKGKDGANSYTIQRKATFPHLKNTADSKIFRWIMRFILLKEKEETGGQTVRIYYTITYKVRIKILFLYWKLFRN